VVDAPERAKSMKNLVDPNFEPNCGTDEDANAEIEEMGWRYDEEDVDKTIIHFEN
jgi:hypothetical protein